MTALLKPPANLSSQRYGSKGKRVPIVASRHLAANPADWAPTASSWRESEGVQAEMALVAELGKRVVYLSVEERP